MTITPVEWVQKDLGAQEVWQKYEDSVKRLTEASGHKVVLTGQLRLAQARLDEAEELVVGRVTAELSKGAKPPTQAAIDRAVKTAVASDEACGMFRKDILDIRLKLDAADSHVESLKIEVRSYSTRLSQLGAELRFYAACKEAETEARRAAVGNPATRWPL